MFTKTGVVKSWDVEVSTPHLVKWTPKVVQADPMPKESSNDLTDLNTSQDELLESSLSSETQEVIVVSLDQAKKEAQEIKAKADAEAQEILKQAEADAETIRSQAQNDVERLRSEVRESVRAEVYPAAKAEGYQAGMSEGLAEGSRFSKSATMFLQMAQHAVQEEYAKVDAELLHLAIKIAERIVRSTLAVEPEKMLSTIQALTLLPQERQGWMLHVAKEDAGWLQEYQLPCPWTADESLTQGDCFLECQEGIFDARLNAQLDKLEHTLREEFKYGSLDLNDSKGGAA
ncbi:flagellar assembly protein H [Desulfosporosinus acididurans]|uniref:Flagellar assembly protein H n=1 Tax=Desulfosporosinus acididurans TaxID=476652 RepID=A0A0J1FNI6_9FIRM|nr:FliH/SctL family protein [Desulfosporosinus acididurans]KLU65054.1 flagellar assembly protein H [Desulfosporosinus acididurans]